MHGLKSFVMLKDQLMYSVLKKQDIINFYTCNNCLFYMIMVLVCSKSYVYLFMMVQVRSKSYVYLLTGVLLYNVVYVRILLFKYTLRLVK